jgi:hypothetical protein
MVILLSYYNNLHCWKLQQFISSELIIPYSLCYVELPFLRLFCTSLHINLLKHGLRFKASSPMLFLFIYKFCKFKWWHYDHLATLSIVATPSIVTTSINDLFQIELPLAILFLLWSYLVLENPNHQWKLSNVTPSFFSHHNLFKQWVYNAQQN